MDIAEIKLSYSTSKSKKPNITDSKAAYKYFKAAWNMDIIELQEEFRILLLNRARQLLGIYLVSTGGTAGTVVDAKLIFAVALKSGASSIILAHNHPSGNLRASQMDISITKKLRSGALFLDLEITDHIILGKDSYTSMADDGII